MSKSASGETSALLSSVRKKSTVCASACLSGAQKSWCPLTIRVNDSFLLQLLLLLLGF